MRAQIRPHEPAELLVDSVDEVFQEAEASQKRWTECEDKAFKDWVKSTWDRVRDFCYDVILDKTEAEDLAQETFIKVWIKRHVYDISWPLLKRIAITTCIDYLRKQRQIQVGSIFDLIGEDLELIDAIPDPQLGPDKLAELAELRPAFGQCWESLNREERLLILCVDWSRWRKWCHQVAQMEGVTYNGVKNQLVRAGRKLLECLRSKGFELTHSEFLELLENGDDQEVM